MNGRHGNSFLQGLMGGANFIDTIHDRQAAREWRKTQQQWAKEDRGIAAEQRQKLDDRWNKNWDLQKKQYDETLIQRGIENTRADARMGMLEDAEVRLVQEDERKTKVAEAQAGIMGAEREQQQRLKAAQKLFGNFKKLQTQQQQKVVDYFMTDVTNQLMPELVNQGNAPGEHKSMIGGKMVENGIIPMVQVLDDDGNEIRRGPLTQNRSSAQGDLPMVAPAPTMVDFLMTSGSGGEAIKMLDNKIASLKQDVVRNRGELPESKEMWGDEYTDEHGNLVQRKLNDNSLKILAAAGKGKGKGKGSGGGSQKTWQFFPGSDEPHQMEIGQGDKKRTVNVINRTWRDTSNNKIYQGSFVDGHLWNKAKDVTDIYLQGDSTGDAGSAGLRTNISGGEYDGGAKAAEKPQPKPEPAPSKPVQLTRKDVEKQNEEEFIKTVNQLSKEGKTKEVNELIKKRHSSLDARDKAHKEFMKKMDQLSKEGKTKEMNELARQWRQGM